MHQFIRSIFMAQEKIMLTLSLSGGLSAIKRNLINFSHANFMRVIVIERERERERVCKQLANNVQIFMSEFIFSKISM